MRVLRAIWTGARATAVLLAFAAPAVAQQQVCLQLETQLAALERQNSPAAYQTLLAQYEQARSAYDRAYRQADQMGCIPRLFRPQLPVSCNAIRADLDRTLQQLNGAQERLRSVEPGQISAQRNGLLRSLAANNCGPQYAQYGAPQIGGGAILERLFGAPTPVPNAPLVSTYRTLCVRSCDGFYFPLSFSTTASMFAADEQLCRQQCPGASLYVYENPGETMEDAVSISGARYSSTANAFAYRQAYNPECSCQGGSTAVDPNARISQPRPESQTIVASLTASIPLPRQRPDLAEDPETLANRSGSFEPGPFSIGAPTQTAVLMLDESGTRLVGPAYYYAR